MEILPAAARAVAPPATPAAFDIIATVPVRSELMGLQLDHLHRDTISQKVIDAARAGGKMMVVNANAQMMVLAQNLPWMKSLFARADIAFCDGAGVQLASRVLQGFALHRTTPPEWIGTVLRTLGANASVFWIGGKPEVVALAARRYELEFGVRTAGIQHGYFDLSADSKENLELVGRINAARPSIVLVNMGMPRQERWIWDNWDRLDTGVVIAAGALVDHAAGIVHRPPRWVANMGLEWLVRLLREPRRLWRRYLLGLPVFAFYIMRFLLKQKRENARLTEAVNRR
jgi:N-acetylglucosaminyldiphosphoundecaprenol N-acetyl-beta-D-mannosaminyltransferase